MGHVEICMNVGEDMKVVLRDHLRWLRVNDLQRRLVAPWPNCSCGTRRSEEASFILVLKALFVFCLIFTLITPLTATFLLDAQISWMPPKHYTRMFEVYILIVFLGVFTAIFVIRVLVKMKNTRLSRERRVEVKTISGNIQYLCLNGTPLNISSA